MELLIGEKMMLINLVRHNDKSKHGSKRTLIPLRKSAKFTEKISRLSINQTVVKEKTEIPLTRKLNTAKPSLPNNSPQVQLLKFGPEFRGNTKLLTKAEIKCKPIPRASFICNGCTGYDHIEDWFQNTMTYSYMPSGTDSLTSKTEESSEDQITFDTFLLDEMSSTMEKRDQAFTVKVERNNAPAYSKEIKWPSIEKSKPILKSVYTQNSHNSEEVLQQTTDLETTNSMKTSATYSTIKIAEKQASNFSGPFTIINEHSDVTYSDENSTKYTSSNVSENNKNIKKKYKKICGGLKSTCMRWSIRWIHPKLKKKPHNNEFDENIQITPAIVSNANVPSDSNDSAKTKKCNGTSIESNMSHNTFVIGKDTVNEKKISRQFLKQDLTDSKKCSTEERDTIMMKIDSHSRRYSYKDAIQGVSSKNIEENFKEVSLVGPELNLIESNNENEIELNSNNIKTMTVFLSSHLNSQIENNNSVQLNENINYEKFIKNINIIKGCLDNNLLNLIKLIESTCLCREINSNIELGDSDKTLIKENNDIIAYNIQEETSQYKNIPKTKSANTSMRLASKTSIAVQNSDHFNVEELNISCSSEQSFSVESSNSVYSRNGYLFMFAFPNPKAGNTEKDCNSCDQLKVSRHYLEEDAANQIRQYFKRNPTNSAKREEDKKRNTKRGVETSEIPTSCHDLKETRNNSTQPSNYTRNYVETERNQELSSAEAANPCENCDNLKNNPIVEMDCTCDDDKTNEMKTKSEKPVFCDESNPRDYLEENAVNDFRNYISDKKKKVDTAEVAVLCNELNNPHYCIDEHTAKELLELVRQQQKGCRNTAEAGIHCDDLEKPKCYLEENAMRDILEYIRSLRRTSSTDCKCDKEENNKTTEITSCCKRDYKEKHARYLEKDAGDDIKQFMKSSHRKHQRDCHHSNVPECCSEQDPCSYYIEMLVKQLCRVKECLMRNVLCPCSDEESKPNYVEVSTGRSTKFKERYAMQITQTRTRTPYTNVSPVTSCMNFTEEREDLSSIYYLLMAIEGRMCRFRGNLHNGL